MSARGDTPLFRAVELGDLADVRRLLDAGADPNQWTAGDDSPLDEAIRRGHETVAIVLVAAGASPDRWPPSATAPLIYAAERGYVDLVRALLQAGADVNVRDEGETALTAAARADRDEVYALLEPLANAPVRAAGGRARAAARKGRGGAPLPPADRLVRAAGEGRVAQVEALLAGGAGVDQYDGHGATALHEAAGLGSPDVVEVLLAAGADPDLPCRNPSYEGDTALHRLLHAPWDPARERVLRQLIEAGADPSVRNAAGQSAEDVAREAFPPDAALEIRRLLERR